MSASATSRMPMPPLGLSWVLSTVSGYGIYGLQILLQYLRRGGLEKDLILTAAASVITVPPLTQARLDPVFALAGRLHGWLKDNPGEILSFRHPVLHGCSSDFAGFPGQDRVWGAPNIACAAIEHLVCTDHGRRIAKNYDMFVAISRWNDAWLRGLGVGPVHLCHQGIDTTLFRPGPRLGLYRDRFVIFSGGKFEFRKGQDIVLAAFKRFHARHDDALLVACWQNLLPPDGEAFAKAGHIAAMPGMAADYGLNLTPWLLGQGLKPAAFIDLPFTHNLLMPTVLRECDMAVFPNRCEGGTNLVAMEAMACGVPTWVSYNTGQKDLVDLIGGNALRVQRAVQPSLAMQTVEDWGESEVDEVVAAMERAYTDREAVRREAAAVAARMEAWDWGLLNEKLLRAVFGEDRTA